jgi:hypothetical protein
MSRLFTKRQQKTPKLEDLEYPYFYLNEYDLTPTQIIGEKQEELIDFPSCITHYYWIHEGENDCYPWRALFKYIDKYNKERYGFYLGECDYTGFDCKGSMRLYLSDNLEILIEKSMTDQDYKFYIQETEETI